MAKNRNLIGFLAGVVVLFLVYWSCPSVEYQPHGVFLPAVHAQPLPPQHTKVVKWLLYPPAWGSYPQLGYISMEFHDAKGLSAGRQQLITAMQALAAQAGGNAIVKEQLFSSAQYTDSSQALWYGKGLVIRAP